MKVQQSDIKNKKQRISGIAALLLGAAILLFSACENDIEKIKPFTAPENLPDVEATNIETMFTDSGEVRFFLKAPRLLRFENEGKGKAFIEFPEGIELIKYNDSKEIISSITADYAKQFEKEKKWEAKNNVVATNAKGDTLKTEYLIWEEEKERIYTEEFVKIIRPDQIITGIGFESDQSLQNWKIKNPKGTIYIDVETEKDTGNNASNNQPAENEPVKNFEGPLKTK
ncbi:MAG: LPS export ABC transporter periplasmic protein LptC [Prolixibacteraceae bacterium]